MQQNTRKSLIATKELLHYLNFSKPDIVLLQEPYTANSDKILGFPLKSILHYKKNSLRPKSGILITNNHLYTELLPEFSNNNITTIKVQLHNSSLIVSNAYIEPNSLTTEHINLLVKIINTHKNQPLIVAGDFNSRHPLWHDNTANPQGIALSDLINDFELDIHNNKEPTCITTNGSSIIDLTLTNNKATPRISNWYTSKQSNTIFDHVSIMFTYQAQFSIPKKTIHSTYKFNESLADWQKFINHVNTNITQLNISINNIHTADQIDSCSLQFTKMIQEAAYQSIPTKKQNKPHRNHTPWWDTSLRLMQITIKNLRNLYAHEKNPIMKQIRYQEYKKYRNKYVKSIYKKKQESWKEFLEETHTKNTWGNTYKLIKSTLASKSYTLPILDKAPPHQHNVIINNILTNIFPDDTSNQHLIEATPNNILDDEQLVITPELINTLVNTSNNKKAPGPDYITNRMLKQIREIISPTLATLFNKCITIGHFPSCWKNATLIIFPKPNKTDYNNPKNYRPISLLSNIGKIFEKVIQNKIQDYLTTHELQNPNQHGFTRHKSTITALSKITDDIIHNKKQRNQLTSIMSVDYSGAFDNANWHRIITNMINMNVPHQYTKIIQSYLSNRSVTFKYNNHEQTKRLTMGCPQGSPLSPLLWNILINTLLNTFNIPNAHIYAYADDITVTCTGKDTDTLHQTLQSSLNFINTWSIQNYLRINVQKTQILHFHTKPMNTPITLNNEHIQTVNTMKILGISFENHRHKNKINFNSHINNIIVKTTRIKNILHNYCKNTFGIDSKKRQNLYKGLIRPVLTYGSEIWINHVNKKHINKLESLQHQILRQSIMAYRTVSKSCVTVLTQIEPLHTNIQIKQLKFRSRNNMYLDIPDNQTLDQYIQQLKDTAIQTAHQNANNTFKSFFPSHKIPKHIIPNFITTQFYTGHGHFQKYLYRFTHSLTELCTCSNTTQDPTHLLLNCTHYTNIKYDLHLHNVNTLEQFIQNKNTYNNFKHLCTHIYKHLKILF